MKKSSQVPAALVAALAATWVAGGTVTGCSSRRCVDTIGNEISDSACTSNRFGAHWISTGGFGGSSSSGGYYGG